ncbi:MAG: tRNA uridine-5-carboxymethylaminomethyl(34) synthesis GTPase MnmE [Bacteroidetes bacterium]|nr:tRNA uridine-5-carboxymethylaminomethyl(34) synthesis GTPase MnmE [Bacteroidota bacterium]
MIGRLKDTIAAISTPIGEGAISVVRVSGESARRLVSNHFSGKLNLTEAKSHTAHFGRFVDSKGGHIDDVVCTVFIAPTSYTGEDTVEVSCHGGIHVTRRVLECLLETGIRLAEPGEFTQRAFLNGKIDLSQAEAIADIIRAQSDKAHKISIDQLEGTLSKEVKEIQDQLVKAAGLLELELDFVEEDIELVDKTEFQQLIESEIISIKKLLDTFKYGKVWREGVRVALVGIPNAGKSRLMNALLKEERAIVTSIPGTTRDFLEEEIIISGVLFRITDTAGLRHTEDSIEKEGVRRTRKIIQNSDIIVLVHDSTSFLITDEIELIKNSLENLPDAYMILANNKTDLENCKSINAKDAYGIQIVNTSALSHEGIEPLKIALERYVIEKSRNDNKESVTITNVRHYNNLLRAKEGLISSLESLKTGKSEEFIALDLRRAIEAIGEIIGVITTEDILNDIFSKFCIGK